MIDVVHQINSVHREVAGRTLEAGEGRTVVLRRTYDASPDDVWDAVTNPERIPRWFLPVTGELRVGGRYQLVGNAGGTITACEPPRRFEATWEFGGGVSWIAVGVAPVDDGGGTQLTLEHTVPVDDHWQQFGPGAVGVGWDLATIGLTLHLSSGGAKVDPEEFGAWNASEDGVRFMAMSSEGWAAAHAASGVAPAEEVEAQAKRSLDAYTGG